MESGGARSEKEPMIQARTHLQGDGIEDAPSCGLSPKSKRTWGYKALVASRAHSPQDVGWSLASADPLLFR
jgi:hypothetical protein